MFCAFLRRWLANLKITVGHWTMSDQNQNLSDQLKKHTRHSVRREKLEAKLNSDQIMLLSDLNWRCPIKLLIFSNKYLSNKSFLISKLQYPRYSFLQKHLYRKTLQNYNSKSLIFTSSSPPRLKLTLPWWGGFPP